MQKTIFVLLLLCLAGGSLQAQVSMRDSSVHINMIHVAYRPLLPVGQLGDRYGLMHNLGFEYTHKFPSNYFIETGINVLADGEVKVTPEFDVLNGLRVGGDFILNDEGTPIVVRQRTGGWLVPLSLGKVFPLSSKSNPNSGVYVKLGTQFFQHKIQFQTREGQVPLLQGETAKAYDLLTSGIGLRQELGYLFLSNEGYVNFSIGFDFSQTFSQNRRSFNTLPESLVPRSSVDLLGGLRFSWIFLIYNKAAGTYFF
ncbi:MAG: hypothetical protein AB8F95_21240 [Bacteroidia bacterium]